MRLKLNLVSIFLLLPVMSNTMAATEVQRAAISKMAQLNGVALQCRFIEQMQQIKRSLVLNLPKQRELGRLFEQGTNESFMQFINNDRACPDALSFSKQINAAGLELEAVFKE